MPILKNLIYRNWDGSSRSMDFVGDQLPEAGFHTTIITGQNGSLKSTILRDLVTALSVHQSDGVTFLNPDVDPQKAKYVICTSGSVADRYPPKTIGGRSTEFDVPNYIYFGQRVGSNLLSKKQPLETVITFALNPSVQERFSEPFYSKAFKIAGVIPRLDLELRRKNLNPKKDRRPLLEDVKASSKNIVPSPIRRHFSKAKADYLLDEFDYDDFSDLERFLSGKKNKRIHLSLSHEGWNHSQELSLASIRLGLISEELTLMDAQVTSRWGNSHYSVFDLSSGEYHMLTTILGLGFALQEGATVLIDEPENSLHPQWQQEFMDTLFGTCANMKDGHLVVSTHSPLIVSAAKQGSTIVDLTNALDSTSATPVLFGASADDILFEQFGIASSRNPSVVALVQRAISLTENNQELEDPGLVSDLRKLRGQLRDDDLLVDIIEALIEGVN